MKPNVAATLFLASACLLMVSACKNQPQYDPGVSAAATQPAYTSVATAASANAGIKGCPDYPFVEDGGLERKGPLPVPAALAGMIAADRDHYAVTSLGGGTVCVDTRSMEQVKNLVASADKRFVSWDWDGMEAFGHVIVDRIGRGTSIDTGVTPRASPSGQRLAAVDWSESAFGALNAFAVWDKAPGGLHPLGRVDNPPEGYTQWQVDGWQGEDCVALSAVSLNQAGEGARLTRFIAHPAGASWTVTAADKDSCGAR